MQKTKPYEHVTGYQETAHPRGRDSTFSRLSYQQTVFPHLGTEIQRRHDSPALGNLRLCYLYLQVLMGFRETLQSDFTLMS